jgi:hypothetical protein
VTVDLGDRAQRVTVPLPEGERDAPMREG